MFNVMPTSVCGRHKVSHGAPVDEHGTSRVGIENTVDT